MAASVLKHTKPDAISKDTQKTPSNKRKGKENISKSKPPSVEKRSSPVHDNDTVWNWASLTDPSSSRISPIFSKDGNYFFSLVGSSVKIYSTASGQVISTLSAPSTDEGNTHSDVLTSSVLNPHNPFQLITASLDGRIMIWDFVNATLLQTIETGQSIQFMCIHEKFKGKVFVAATKHKKKSGSDTGATIIQVSLKADETGKPSEVFAVGKTRVPTGLAVSPNGEWLVALAGHKVYVAKTASLHDGFTKYVSPERLRCLAFHPTEEYFATGDDKGVVRLWYCLNNDLAVNVRGVEKRTQTRSLHWHAHAVSSLAFTPNGAYLLTGGEESVLVIWQLHTGKKEFVPRLGAPISTVSIAPLNGGEEEYLIGLVDATYTFISSSTLKVVRSYSRIKIDPAHAQEYPSTSKLTSTPIAIQPLTSTIMLPSSHPSSLQMYSPSTSTLISELEISPSNRVSRRDDKPLIPAIVETAVISTSGLWMATIDCREGEVGFRSEVYLKIWSWDSNQNTWILNTRIDRPHGSDKVTDVSFSPNTDDTKPLHLVTTGKDGLIKLWKLWKGKKSPTGDSGVDTWASYATLSYRSEAPISVSWSPDASLFAVAAGAYVVLYDAISASVRQTLTSPSCTKVNSIRFIGADGCHLLASGEDVLVMWDLINMEVAWEHKMQQPIYKIVAHPKDLSFAAFHVPHVADEEYSTKVTIFDAASNTPKSTHSVPFGLRNIIWNTSNKRSGYNLIGITHSWRVVMMGDSVQTFNDEGLTAKGLSMGQGPQRKTLFQDIFGASAFAATESEVTPVPSLLRNDNKLPEIFNTPAYLAPSLEFLFDPLVKAMLVTRPVEATTALEEDVDEDEDVSMEDEPSVTAYSSVSHSSRAPVPGEMDAFVKLFKQCCMTETPTIPKLSSKLNSARLKEINGSHRPMETPLARARRASSQPEVGPLPVLHPSPSPLLNGKKRKKASS